ncbi:ATP-binding sensor histidine kinase [Geitlerinema sp. PCC 7407]|uniref:trifunctional serine/threonine-protein kinase/ATP-binding protein/sensor histidine kinase n=1 Tax=Geitlerinema sp. PCC 7407 TaxID=1173025 RepID=UPI00029F9478|nr:multi-sensor signal transduction multi-kinase [Geitlerinema sp. PCC 7407]
MMDVLISVPGYTLNELIYSSSRTLVYRGCRESDQMPVVVKLLKNLYPSLAELAQFKNQYTLVKYLNLPGVVRPYSLEHYQNRLALVMEDFGGIPLRDYFLVDGKVRSLAEFFDTAIAIATILDGLYQHQVIHKDIKPTNILIHPVTRQVKLTDFSIASRLLRETQTATSPAVLEGTLAYVSPEQTGRMNRGVDYRTDFYSLGVTFYELLTGHLPFQSEDPLELVHCHIAKQPAPIIYRNPEVPAILSDIVRKLMAKNAEDRYQSALGLRHDLEICQRQWQHSGSIQAFPLAERDVCDRFVIPEKLYGRESEVHTLLDAFERVQQGATELMLVSGFSGIGKTAVINEVHKPIVRQRGYFIKGKFDQFQRDIPFSALVQALRDLMDQLLTESDRQIEQWQSKILAALGENGQVIIDVIPELEQIIGPQPPVSELSGSAVQNRFNLLFQKFIQVFTSQEHPLVIFLDDLQWADTASLKLMQLLLSEADSHYLLVIGAYRDNEVTAAHPLMLTIDMLRQAEVSIRAIALSPLSGQDLNQLVAETLSELPENVQLLTDLIYQRTQGNPFFSSQFFKSLYEDKLITFDYSSGCWQWRLSDIRTLSFTEDVVEFVAAQLQKLPTQTQEVLKLAACVGNQFDLSTLAIVSERSLAEVAQDLWPALKENLILPQGDSYKLFQEEDFGSQAGHLEVNQSHFSNAFSESLEAESCVYKFLHDRVQQAAYSLIPIDQKQATHQAMGQLLLRNIPVAEWEEKIFEIVNQLNMGMELIENDSDRHQLAQLNAIAGQKAKSSTAYTLAIKYFQSGISLLSDNAWSNHYELALTLHEDAAEAAYLDGRFEKVNIFANPVIIHGQTALDQVKVHDAIIQSFGAQNKALEAVSIALGFLEKLGFSLPLNPTQQDIQQDLERINQILADRPIEELIDLPMMTEARSLAAMRILASITAFSYQVVPELFLLVVSQQIYLSIHDGNAPFSAFAYASYGLILCEVLGDIEAGYQFGKLGTDLLSKVSAKAVTTKTIQTFNGLVRHWKDHLQDTIKPLLETYSVGLETGDLEFAAYSLRTCSYAAYFMGRDLSILQQEIAAYSEAIRQMKQTGTLYWNELYRQVVLNLQGQSDHPCQITGVAYSEETILPLHLEANDVCTLMHFYFCKLQLFYLFGDYAQAWHFAGKAEQCLAGVAGQSIIPIFCFYQSLTALAQIPEAAPEDQAALFGKVAQNQVKLKKWAYHSPANYLHKYELVQAEEMRVLGQMAQAVDLYDCAIADAQANEYLQEEALANELAAKFYLTWEKEAIAKAYLANAYYDYVRWGAIAKVKFLEQHYSHLLTSVLQPEESTTPVRVRTTTTGSDRSSSTMSEALDLATVMKASQVLSGEIELEKLLETLIKVVLENAGAETCVLLLRHEDRWVIAAEQTPNTQSTVMLSSLNCFSAASTEVSLESLSKETAESSGSIPQSVINYVARTAETLVLDDARSATNFASDRYILTHQPKSLLCTPIHNQGKLIGILYLENNLTTGAFTRNRLEILRLLTVQAAISLQNSLLYHNLSIAKVQLEDANCTLENKVQQRTEELHEKNQRLSSTLEELRRTQTQLIQTEKMSSLGQMVAGIAHEINNPINFIYGNIAHANEYFKDMLHLVEQYQHYYPEPHEAIAAELEEIDFEFLRNDLQKLLQSMKLGADRIRQIILSLRNFSRLDEAEMKPVDIHEGIESTLLILQHRLKEKNHRSSISLIRDYGTLPRVTCYASQMNQVLMNVLNNAIDAMEERRHQDENYHPEIRIRTGLKDDQALTIEIMDNGAGMPEEVKKRLFDPFFTTKPVGKGTGLGLSICYAIIEKHKGSMKISSEVGRGTKILISIPVRYSADNQSVA